MPDNLKVQQHPAYCEGFFEAMGDTPIHDDCLPEYRAGWEAAMRSRDILRGAGFTQNGCDFTAAATLTNGERDATS
jgi:hypothetical protein